MPFTAIDTRNAVAFVAANIAGEPDIDAAIMFTRIGQMLQELQDIKLRQHEDEMDAKFNEYDYILETEGCESCDTY